MRRKDRIKTEVSEILDIMKHCKVCSLALNGEGYPYVVPVNFGVKEQDGVFTLYFHGAGEGTKMDLIKKDGRASFCMTCGETFEMQDTACSATMRYESVCGDGLIEIVKPVEEKIKGLSCIMRQYARDGRTEFEFDDRMIGKTEVLRLTVGHITGKVNERPH